MLVGPRGPADDRRLFGNRDFRLCFDALLLDLLGQSVLLAPRKKTTQPYQIAKAGPAEHKIKWCFRMLPAPRDYHWARLNMMPIMNRASTPIENPDSQARMSA